MKRYRMLQCGFLAAVLGLAGAAIAQQEATPPTRGEQEKSTETPANKNGTGVVPQGVKLESQMPAAGGPKAFHFPKAATKTLPNGLRIYV
ncbi:MAG: hypothetical protein ACRD3B_13975, partial [Candidatus Sulfotelmatobacter sp.]